MSTILSQLKPLKIGDLTAKLPIIQGGMGVGISLSSLAGAVAGAGGIGIISTAQIGFREPDFAEHPQEANLRAIGSELQKARAIAKGGIVGFNIMVATKNYAEYVKTAVKAGADLIISGAGLPVSLPEYVKGTATKIAPIVSSVKAATVICRMWDRKYQTAPDLVVVEGPLAGGHLGFDREKLTELEVDTPHAAETFHQAEYDEEVRGIIALVKKYAQKYGKSIPVVTAGGKELMDFIDTQVKNAYFLPEDAPEKEACRDFMWYLWNGAKSPVFGKDKNRSFEHYFIEDPEVMRETMNPYYQLSEEEETCDMILKEFGLPTKGSHIINGHMPVKIKSGETPIRAGGKLFIIDGGLSKAYQERTGIAGYTLIFNSHHLALAEHKPFDPERERTPKVYIVEKMQKRITVADTDEGKELAGRIEDLKELLKAYRSGLLKERIR